MVQGGYEVSGWIEYFCSPHRNVSRPMAELKGSLWGKLCKEIILMLSELGLISVCT